MVVKVCFADQVFSESNSQLPLIKKPFFVLSDDKHITLESLEQQYYESSVSRDQVTEDIPLGLEKIRTPDAQKFDNTELFSFTYMGKYEDRNLLRINLLSFDSQIQKCIHCIKIEISGARVTLLSDSLFYSTVNKLTHIKKSKTVNYKVDEYILTGKKRLKMYIRNEGIYSLTGKLIEKSGWNISGIAPDCLQLISQGKEIPVHITGAEDGSFDKKDIIEFWGEPVWSNNTDEKSLNIYTNYNIYWLIIGNKPGLRIGNQSAILDRPNSQQKLYPVSFPCTKHIEENNFFHRLAYAQDVIMEDHWLYSGTISGGEKKEFNFYIYSPYVFSNNPVNIDFKLRGQCAQYGNHPIEFYVNNQYIGSTSWNNYDKISFTSNNISPIHLKEGNNELTIVNKSSSGLFSQLYLDWFKITYPREFITDSDFLVFNPPQNSKNRIVHFEIKGFSHSDIKIFKKNNSIIYNPDIEAVIDTMGNTTYDISFEDRIGDESIKYTALTKSETAIPDSIIFIDQDYLRSREFGADYLMISPVDSLGMENENIRDLIAHRESQGLNVKVADLQNIYNEFNYGISSPDAIKNFLKYAVKYWHPSPRFVLLVGDGTINPKTSMKNGNLLPVPLYQTVKYGGAPADFYYSLLTENDVDPDIALGRLPIQNKNELKNVIQKIIDYENDSRGTWRNDYLMISAGTKDGDFGYQAEYIINNVMSPSINPKRMYLSGSIDDPYLGGTEDLLRHFRNGTAWINFRGHGGGAIWSDGGLLDIDDIPLLENRGKLPFITSMTCFTSDFASRKRSLGESLLLKDETGAVAFFGSTGLGWVWNDYYLLKELFQCYTLFPDMTIGELINKAKITYLLKYQSTLALSEVYHFLLLGDPALKLTLPAEKTPIKLTSQAISKNNTVHINGKAESSNVNIDFAITDSSYATTYSETFSVDETDWNFELPIPENLYGFQSGIRAYLWDPDSDYQMRGFSPFSYGTSFFDSLSVLPENPTYQDSLYFTVRIEDVRDIKDVYCIIDHTVTDTLSMYKTNKLFRTDKISSFTPGTHIKFYCIVSHEDGTVTTSTSQEIIIPLFADLHIQSLFLSGTDKVTLNAEIKNFGQTDADDVIVQFSAQEQDFYATDTVSVQKSNTTTSSVTFYPVIGINTASVTIDPDSLINEISKNNNQSTREITANRFWITPELGSTIDFNSSDTVGIPEKVLVFIPPNTVNQPTSVGFKFLNQLPYTNALQKQGTSEIYSIFFPGLGEENLNEKKASFLFSKDTVKNQQPYIWNTTLHNWISCDYQVINDYIQVMSSQSGYFSFLTYDDNNPPYIDIEVDNQAFTQNSYVSRTSLFNVLLQDESAIDLRPSGIIIFIDNTQIPYSDLMIPDSINSLTDINISFKPDLQPGQHSLQIHVKDIHGNINKNTNVKFKVGSDLNLDYLGNHPNPFQVETVFVYVLTDVAKDVSLKIYTVSGKLIRNMNDNTMASPDYHEIVWDGRDEWGNLVANGVYFYKLTAQGFDKTQKVTGKIAKVR
ncbi:MAG: C25 family cysteine peptidase [bacterium]